MSTEIPHSGPNGMHARSTFRLDAPLNLRETLFAARWGPRDPCMRIFDHQAWRATRTPMGPAAECLTIGPDGLVTVEAWGSGADWLLERAPSLCGAQDQPTEVKPEQPLLKRLEIGRASCRERV